MKIKLNKDNQWTINDYFRFRCSILEDLWLSTQSDCYNLISLSKKRNLIEDLDKQYRKIIGDPDIDLTIKTGESFSIHEYFSLKDSIKLERTDWLIQDKILLGKIEAKDTVENNDIISELDLLYTQRHLGFILFETENPKSISIAGEDFVKIPNAIMLSVNDSNMTFDIAREITQFIIGENIHNYGMNLINKMVRTITSLNDAAIIEDNIPIKISMIISEYIDFNPFITIDNTPELMQIASYIDSVMHIGDDFNTEI